MSDFDDIEKDLNARLGLWLRDIPLMRGRLAAIQPQPEAADLVRVAADQAVLGREGRALNYLAASLTIEPHAALEHARRAHLFACSGYGFNPRVPLALASSILPHAGEFGFSPDEHAYLTSVVALLRFGRHAQEEVRILVKALRRQQLTLIRGCLITVDCLFLRDMYPEVDWGLHLETGEFTKEELAEGFSYLCHLLREEIGLTKRTAGLWDVEQIDSGHYLSVLTRAASLRKYREVERLIDGFEFRCQRDPRTSCLVVTAPTPAVEKSIRLAYIDAQQRRGPPLEVLKRAGWPSLRDVAEGLHRFAKARALIQERGPLRRLRFEIPITQELVQLVRSGPTAAEDVVSIANAVEDYHVDARTLSGFQISPHLSLLDISRVHRLALITGAFTVAELRAHVKDRELLLNSVMPVYLDAALDELLGVALERKESVQEFKAMFGWPPPELSGDEKLPFFDLQYRPMLRAVDDASIPLPGGGEWNVPIHVLGGSNLVRAALLSTRKRPLSASAEHEVLGETLAAAIRAHGHAARSGMGIRVGGTSLEVDGIAAVGNVLLLLECKSSLLPCSPFELGTTFEHCAKAARQLSRLVDALGTEDQHRAVCGRLDVDERAIDRIVTGVVIDNGLFAGRRIDNHLVVSFRHLEAFLRGSLSVLGVPLRAPAAPLTSEDVVRFFAGELYDRLFAAMVEVDEEIRLGASRLLLRSYALSGDLLARDFGVDLRAVLDAEGRHWTGESEVGPAGADEQETRTPATAVLKPSDPC